MTLNETIPGGALNPFRIAPFFRKMVWGTDDLRPWYDRIATDGPIGEVWLTGDQCVIETGPNSGRTLGDMFASAPEALLGLRINSTGSPLLVKIIFAKQKLSVQVHPDDAMAAKYGFPRGKTECWYALAADPGAQVACGLKQGVTLETVKAGIETGKLEESLDMLAVSSGDLIFVDAGTVHAIWPGSILLEIQQNSDVTYRMYDYGRPRELHIEKSLEATRLKTRAGKIPPIPGQDRTTLIEAAYFSVERIPVNVRRSSASLPAKSGAEPRLSYLFAASGSGRIAGRDIDPVDLPQRGIVAVPATSREFEIEDRGGLDLIRIAPNTPLGKG